MKILGLSAYYHDSAACLLLDGAIVAAAQEERFTRKRHDSAFPSRAIAYCLAQGKISIDDVDAVAFYEKPFVKFERILETLLDDVPRTLPLALKALPVWLTQKLWMRRQIAKELGRPVPVLFCAHHEAHAASAFFPSPFREAATLTVDGVGEWSTTSWGIGRGDRLDLKAEIRYPHSLGLLYSAFTQYLGFKVNSAEYKVMGLAPYGDPRFASLIKENFVELFPDGSFALNTDHFSFSRTESTIAKSFDEVMGRPRRSPESKLEPFHADVARSIQAVTEEIMLALARHVHSQTGSRNLCLAGGVALNCVANGKILAQGPFERIWIQPAAGDAGGAIGSALVAWHHAAGRARSAGETDSQAGSYLGPEYGPEEIERALQAAGVRYRRLDEAGLVRETAALLASRKIVGWFQGRMEFGPRALGNRSILGDPRDPEMQRRMNLKIKFRESFRPFAPSVLAEDTARHFELRSESPYMLLTCPVRGWVGGPRPSEESDDKWMSHRLAAVPGDIPAVTHVDGSARVHTVDKKVNPLFHSLLSAFKETTGCGVLINTSFNVRGEPIVCTPDDAVKCFLRTHIDVLAAGPFLVVRDEQDGAWLEAVRERLQKEERFELD